MVRYEADLSKPKEDLAGAMKTKLDKNMDNSGLYQKSYSAEFDLVCFPTGWCVPIFVKFSGDDNSAPWDHIDQYLLQLGKADFHDALRIRLFSLSLTGTTFSWFSSLARILFNLGISWNVSFMIVFIMGTMKLNYWIWHRLGKAKMSLLRITSEGLKI